MLLTVVAAIAGGSRYGPQGVCAALVIRGIAAFPALVYVMKKTSGIQPSEYLKALLPSIACGAAAAAVCAALSSALTDLFPVHHTVRLTACVLVSAAVYVTAMALFFGEKLKMLRSYSRSS